MIERRNGKRFAVNWPLKVTGPDGKHKVSGEGTVRNISSGGALFDLPGPVTEGMKLEVYIKLPFKNDNWMKYTAEVVRVEDGQANCAAVKFDGPRPLFA